MCFYRDDNEVVPGCDNDSAVRGVDYCVERTNEILQEIESDLVGEGGYGRCEGTLCISCMVYPFVVSSEHSAHILCTLSFHIASTPKETVTQT